MTAEAVLLVFNAVLLLAVLVVFFRIVNSSGSVTWSVKTTIPDDPWALRFSPADREKAMRKFARERFESDTE